MKLASRACFNNNNNSRICSANISSSGCSMRYILLLPQSLDTISRLHLQCLIAHCHTSKDQAFLAAIMVLEKRYSNALTPLSYLVTISFKVSAIWFHYRQIHTQSTYLFATYRVPICTLGTRAAI